MRSADGRSPLYDKLWRRLANEPLVDEVVDDYSFRTPLELAAGLHYLVLEGRASWADPEAALVEHRDFLRRFVADRAVQTNEVQRSWMLLPCFLEIVRRTGAERLDLIELGPSAGLNLIWDRYRYRYANGAWGNADAPLELAGQEKRPVPPRLLALRPVVRSRVGVDRSPIDVTSEDEARLLKSFIWADQSWRLDLLDRAIEVLRDGPPPIVRGDLADELPRLLARRSTDALTVVYHTAVLGYLPLERRRQVYALLAEAGQTGMLAIVGTGTPDDDVQTCYALRIQIWPGGEREAVAHADFHGAWLEWLA